MGNMFKFKWDDGYEYEVVPPENYTREQTVAATEWLLGMLKRSYYSYLTEYVVTIPMPKEFYVDDTVFFVEKLGKWK